MQNLRLPVSCWRHLEVPLLPREVIDLGFLFGSLNLKILRIVMSEKPHSWLCG